MRGGDKFRRRLAGLASQSSGSLKVRVGIFESAKYEDGTPVAAVAFWNEYGTANIPPRPFCISPIRARRALKRNVFGLAARRIAAPVARMYPARCKPALPKTFAQTSSAETEIALASCGLYGSA